MNLTAPIIGIARHRIPTDGEGVTTLVAFGRCPLQCQYCLNPQCHNEAKRHLTPEELLEVVRVDDLYFLATGGGICFGGGEPALRSRYIADFYRLMPPAWHLTIETSLSVPTPHIERLAPFIGQWVIDVKDMNPAIYRSYTGRPIDALMQNLRYLIGHNLQDRCTLRIPLIPDYNSAEAQQESRQQLQDMGFTRFDLFDYRVK